MDGLTPEELLAVREAVDAAIARMQARAHDGDPSFRHGDLAVLVRARRKLA